MQTAKKEVSELLARLPDDCALEDIQYHLYVLQKVGRGLNDVSKGATVPHNKVEKLMASRAMRVKRAAAINSFSNVPN